MTEKAVAKQKVYARPALRTGISFPFCRGCHYGIIARVLCEALDEMNLGGKAILIVDIGCHSFFAFDAINIDAAQSNHGRSMTVAVAIKRIRPDALVFNVQGDGGLAGIGAGHFVNTMLRAEKITTIFLNNGGYGLTGGQMAPTTLLGMRSTTTVRGRDPRSTGFPFHAAEMAATMKGVSYSARVSVHTPGQFQKAKKAVKTAFQKQVEGIGYSIVEFLSACPTGWGLDPTDSLKFMEERMMAEYSLGEFKNVDSIDYSIPQSGPSG